MVRFKYPTKEDNDLFYVCSLIEYIARKTKNNRDINQIGKARLEKIYDLADVYHCDNIERVADDFIEESGVQEGKFDNVADCRYAVPSYWDIGKVYKRFIIMKQQSLDETQLLFDSLMQKYFG